MTIQAVAMQNFVDYRPSFELCESDSLELMDKQIGEKVQAIIDYKVIEKTKSFTMVKIMYVHLLPTKRKF